MTAREAFNEGQASFQRANQAFDDVFAQSQTDKNREVWEEMERKKGYKQADIERGRTGFGAFLSKTGSVDDETLRRAEADERAIAKDVPLLRAYTVIDAAPEYRRYMKRRIEGNLRRLQELSSQFE